MKSRLQVPAYYQREAGYEVPVENDKRGGVFRWGR